MSTASPLFSVIIPTYHRNDLLAKCLNCLAPGVQTLPVEQYEVIVTDDGSETTAEPMIQEQYPWAKWVAGKHKGPAANRNNGASYSRGEWLAFTDDDCLPDPQWLSALSMAIEKEVLALEGAIHPLGNLDRDLAECPVNLTGGCFWSANIAIKRSLFEKIGGFDVNYPLAAHEDQDIKLRLSPHTNILFVPAAAVFHPVRLITLRQKITCMPKRCAALAYHLNKHQKILGYTKIHTLIFKQYKFHIRTMTNRFMHWHLKSVCVSFLMLIYGIVLCLFYFYYYQHRSSTLNVVKATQ